MDSEKDSNISLDDSSDFLMKPKENSAPEMTEYEKLMADYLATRKENDDAMAKDAAAMEYESHATYSEGKYDHPSQSYPLRKERNPLQLLSSNTKTTIADCPKCLHLFRQEVDRQDICFAFPVPSKPEVLLSVIGSLDVATGTERPKEELIDSLKALELLLEVALRASNEVYIDLADAEPSEEIISQVQKYAKAIPGWIDFLLAVGFEREDTALIFFREPEYRPCQRVVIALQLVQSELDKLINCNGMRNLTMPVMSQIGPMLTLFGDAQSRMENSHYFPTFKDDLLCWIELRNYFYTCFVVSSGDGGQADTWLTYFENCRDAAQEVLERVESRHESLKLKGSLETLLSESTRVFELLRTAHQPKPVSVDMLATPPSLRGKSQSMGGTDPSPTLASPGELLLRTPQHAVDRECYAVSAPSPSSWIRDDPNKPIGMLNMRSCCYVNSLIQMLYANTAFVNAVLSFENPIATFTSPQVKILQRLQVVFGYARASSCSCLNPVPLLESVAQAYPSFGNAGEHDPHEFAACLFEAVQIACDQIASKLKEADVPKENVTAQKAFGQTSARIRSAWSCCLKETALDFRGEVAEEPPTIQPQTALIPLYFDAADVQALQEVCLPKRGSASHVDPTQLMPPKPTMLSQSFDDFLTEARGTENGVTRELTEAPPSLVFYIPSRAHGAGPSLDLSFDFPPSIDLTPAMKSQDRTLLQGKLEMEKLLRERAQLKQIKSQVLATLLEVPACMHASTQALRDDIHRNLQLNENRLHALTEDRMAHVSQLECASESGYDLVSIVVHLGQTSDAGHYYAFVKRSDGWFRCDDSTVESASVQQVFSPDTFAGVYCLFYTLREQNVEDVAIPRRIQSLIEKEDMRKQLRMAQRLSISS